MGPGLWQWMLSPLQNMLLGYSRRGQPFGNPSPSSPRPCGGASVIRIATLDTPSLQSAVKLICKASVEASGPSPPPDAESESKTCATTPGSATKVTCSGLEPGRGVRAFVTKELSCGGWSRNATTPNLRSPCAKLPCCVRETHIFLISARALSM